MQLLMSKNKIYCEKSMIGWKWCWYEVENDQLWESVYSV